MLPTEPQQTPNSLKLIADTLPESVLGALFDKNPLPMWIYDVQTLQFLAVNDSAIHHYGYSHNDFHTMTIADIRPADDVPSLLDNINHVEDRLDRAGVWRHVKYDGSLIYVEITSYPLDFLNRRSELVIAYDVSARVAAESEMQNLLQCEALVADITRELASNQSLHLAIDNSLQKVGQYGSASRSYVFQWNPDGNSMTNTHEWCAPGVESQIQLLQNIDMSPFAWSLSQIKQGKTLSVPDINQLPEVANSEKEIFSDLDIKSLIMVPMHINQDTLGFMGFDNVMAAQPWSRNTQNMLEIVAEQIGSAIQRQHDKDKLSINAQQLDSIMRSAEHFVFYRLATDRSAKQLAQVEFVSDSLSDIIGVEPGTDFSAWFSHVHPEDLPELERQNAIAADQHTAFDMVLRLFHPQQGQWRWIRAVSNPVIDESGNLTHYNGFLLDVSDMVTASRALQTERDFANAIMGTVGALVVVLDDSGRVIRFNRACEQVTGYSSDEIVGSFNWDKLLLPKDRQIVKDVFEQLKSDSNDAARSFEINWLSRTGEHMLISWTYTSIRNIEGELQYAIGSGMDVTQLRRANEELERLASFDSLTGLPNRRLFRDRLTHALSRVKRHSVEIALLYLDLDDFKRINDSLGHDVGDKLLKKTAQRLQHCVREEDTVARLGGDEFVILLQSVTNDIHPGTVAAKILKHIREPMILDEYELVVTGSIGITTAPGDSMDPGTLLRNADLAMYRSKSKGCNEYEYFKHQMNIDASKRLDMEVELRQAFNNNQLKPYFQPIVRLSDMQIVGFEALARWQHPHKGFIPPDQFIPVAEDCGIIVPLGHSLLRQAAQEIKKLRDAHNRELYVAFNLSASQVQDSRLVEIIVDVLRETGLPSHALRLEITESMLLKDFTMTRKLIEDLKQKMGTYVSLDDFGTGYSSLSYLKQLPIDAIKIDRSFVKDIPDDQDDVEITAAIIAVAQALRKSVVAEGIETRQQVDFLLQKHCTYGQGFLLGKPAEPRSFINRTLLINLDER
jgi:diguanylate cyclase (GGDEF)-like protein/PAS domain S-box-containing protein